MAISKLSVSSHAKIRREKRAQWQPQEGPQPPPMGEALAPSEDLPLAGAAKTESCTVFLVLSHFGQATTVALFITMRS
jgi:hypothetical protein